MNDFDNALGQIKNSRNILIDYAGAKVMKTYKHIYNELCSMDNLKSAYEKARKGKSKKSSVLEFEKNLEQNLLNLQKELLTQTYRPLSLKRFIVRDPKTRVIHASAFRDRVVHHAIVNILEPIYEKIFICDSYASRLNKGTHPALRRFDYFKRKVSTNGTFVLSGGGGKRQKQY